MQNHNPLIKLPNFRHLLIIDAVVRYGGVRAASSALNLSQPAISQAIGKLERDLDISLFERGTGSIRATPAGRQLAERVERAVSILQAAEAELFTGGPKGARHRHLHRMISTSQLLALVYVVEQGGFSGAARFLKISQPSVHRHARDLERLCGLPLFNAKRQRIEPTFEARNLACHAALALSEIEHGLVELREAQGILDGRVVIGCLPLVRSQILPTAVLRLLEIYPNVKVRIVDGPYGELLHAMTHGRLDMLLGALRPQVGGAHIHQEVLFDDPLSIVVRSGHPLLSHRPFDSKALFTLDWIAPPEGTPARTYFAAFLHDRGLKFPERIIECSSLIATRGLLLNSNRAALLSARQVATEVETGQLVVLPVSLPGTGRPIGITTRTGWRPTQVQQDFLSIIRTVITEAIATQ